MFVDLHSYILENQGLMVFGNRENGRESERKKEQRKSLLETNRNVNYKSQAQMSYLLEEIRTLYTNY